jgi:uncharacterized membrane protein
MPEKNLSPQCSELHSRRIGSRVIPLLRLPQAAILFAQFTLSLALAAAASPAVRAQDTVQPNADDREQAGGVASARSNDGRAIQGAVPVQPQTRSVARSSPADDGAHSDGAGAGRTGIREVQAAGLAWPQRTPEPLWHPPNRILGSTGLTWGRPSLSYNSHP